MSDTIDNSAFLEAREIEISKGEQIAYRDNLKNQQISYANTLRSGLGKEISEYLNNPPKVKKPNKVKLFFKKLFDKISE